jgi:hypothetical protein
VLQCYESKRINGRQYRLNKSRPIGRNAFI